MRHALRRQILRVSPLALLIATGCSAATLASEGSLVVEPTKIAIVEVKTGQLSVSGEPGAVTGAGADSVKLVLARPAPSHHYSIEHVLPPQTLATSLAKLNRDGGFSAVTLGGGQVPVAPGDRLTVTPMRGASEAGAAVTLQLP